MKRSTLALLLALLLALGLTACGGMASNGSSGGSVSYEANSPPKSASASDIAPMEEYGYWEDAEVPAAAERGREDFSSNLPDGVKMIYRANLELETTEFGQATSDIATLTQALGGYFEEQSTHNYSSGYRQASYTVRVPAERFDNFLHRLGDLCHVRYSTRSAENVSEYYYDMESRLETARIKLDRLQELLSGAEAMEDIITIESAISETEYQIESLSGELRHYDALIGYSTIYISLSEVYRLSEAETAPLTFGERMSQSFRSGLQSFGESLEDFAVWFAYHWLGLLVLLAIVSLIVWIARAAKRKKQQPQPRERRKLFGRKKQDTSNAGSAEDDNS